MTRFAIRPATRRGILFLAIAAVASYLALRDASQVLQGPLADLDTRLNYALFDFRALLLDEQGELAMTIEAPLLRNNAASQVGSISRPRIFVRDNGNEWTIEADSAVITPDREFVSLAGEVSMFRYNARERDALEIDTRDVLIKVEPRMATTEAEVVMRHGGDRLQSTGMNLDMINERYELLDKVRIQYDTF